MIFKQPTPNWEDLLENRDNIAMKCDVSPLNDTQRKLSCKEQL